MTAFAHHFSYEFKTALRNSTQMLMNYLFPLFFYIMMGLVMTEINPLFKDTLIPAMAIFAIMVSTLLGLPGPLVEAREAGIFRSYKINGIPAISILTIPGLTSAFHALIMTAVIAASAPVFFEGAMPANWWAFAGISLLSAFTFAAIGLLIGVVATGSRSTVLWSQLIFLPSMLLSGMMMPLDILPASVGKIARLLPTTQAMQAYLGAAYGQETLVNPNLAIGILATGGVLALALAIFLFNWDNRNSARRGHPLMALIAVLPYLAGIFLS